MQLVINNTDISTKITKYDYVEIPRIVTGRNQITTISGDEYNDIIARKFDLKVKLMPMTASEFSAIATLCSADTVVVTYMSAATNSLRTMRAQPTISEIPLAIDNVTSKIYFGMELTLKEMRAS